MDLKKIRRDFPTIQREVGGKPIVYLDSACMSLKPRQVTDAIVDYYTRLGACGGRSVHKLATEVSIKYEEGRERHRRFLNANDHREIVFKRNATGRTEAIGALGLPVLKFLIAKHVPGEFQAPGLDAQIAVGCLKNVAQFRERKRFLHDQRGEDAQAQSFVD